MYIVKSVYSFLCLLGVGNHQPGAGTGGDNNEEDGWDSPREPARRPRRKRKESQRKEEGQSQRGGRKV